MDEFFSLSDKTSIYFSRNKSSIVYNLMLFKLLSKASSCNIIPHLPFPVQLCLEQTLISVLNYVYLLFM